MAAQHANQRRVTSLRQPYASCATKPNARRSCNTTRQGRTRQRTPRRAGAAPASQLDAASASPSARGAGRSSRPRDLPDRGSPRSASTPHGRGSFSGAEGGPWLLEHISHHGRWIVRSRMAHGLTRGGAIASGSNRSRPGSPAAGRPAPGRGVVRAHTARPSRPAELVRCLGHRATATKWLRRTKRVAKSASSRWTPAAPRPSALGPDHQPVLGSPCPARAA